MRSSTEQLLLDSAGQAVVQPVACAFEQDQHSARRRARGGRFAAIAEVDASSR
jgi:hypothetical protein